MASKNRGDRDGKQRRKPRTRVDRDVDFVTMPIVGKVRVLRSADGRGWDYDPTFIPELPPGAIRGNIARQVYCCHMPYFAYVDIRRTCVQCGEEFVFSAAEQKHWYETLQFRLDSRAVRCLGCRRSARSDKAVTARYAAAAANRDSANPADLVELASALCAMVDRGLGGKPDEIVAAARKAHKADPNWPEPHYWEGRGHQHAGRATKAAAAFDSFLAVSATKNPAARRLVADATARRAELEALLG